MHLIPHPWLFLRTILGYLCAVTLAGYLWQGFHDGYWWPVEYFISLLLPFIIMPLLCWIFFVPLDLVVSDTSLVIRYPFRSRHEIAWNELQSWGDSSEATFLLQFSKGRTYAIALFAYPCHQRQTLIDFLRRRFCQQKARGWFGDRGFR